MKKTSIYFLALLVFQTILLLVYTVIAFNNAGANLFASAINDVAALKWQGQFALDFSSYLVLSGLWIMWRNRFSAGGIATGVTAMVLGILFFAPYLFYLHLKTKGDIKVLLLGKRL